MVSKGIKDKVSYSIFLTFSCADKIQYCEALKKVQEKSENVGLHFQETLFWVNETQQTYEQRHNQEQWHNLAKLLKKAEREWKPKKAILVAGKMGHGKSSFIKMLVTKQEKNLVGVGDGTTNKTNECQAYLIDPTKS